MPPSYSTLAFDVAQAAWLGILPCWYCIVKTRFFGTPAAQCIEIRIACRPLERVLFDLKNSHSNSSDVSSCPFASSWCSLHCFACAGPSALSLFKRTWARVKLLYLNQTNEISDSPWSYSMYLILKNRLCSIHAYQLENSGSLPWAFTNESNRNFLTILEVKANVIELAAVIVLQSWFPGNYVQQRS